MRLAALLLVLGLGPVACACGRSEHRWHRVPPLGPRLLVLAPHPDDEVLGAAGAIERATRSGAEVTVVVATDGERGRDRTGASDLGRTREAETRRAVARLGVAEDGLRFLRYADGGLAEAWGERWTTARSAAMPESSERVVEDLRAALRAAAPAAVLLPSPLDEHGDHRALGRFALLALLAERPALGMPRVLAYLIHAGRGWPARAVADACVPTLFPWSALFLDEAELGAKAALVRGYRTQLGPALLRYARREERFAVGEVVDAPRTPGPTHPGVLRAPGRIVIRVPRGVCVLPHDGGARLRLRFLEDDRVAERAVVLGSPPAVTGGRPGEPLAPVSDVRVTLGPSALRLELGGRFPELAGVVLEIQPGAPHRTAPAWLLLW